MNVYYTVLWTDEHGENSQRFEHRTDAVEFYVEKRQDRTTNPRASMWETRQYA